MRKRCGPGGHRSWQGESTSDGAGAAGRGWTHTFFYGRVLHSVPIPPLVVAPERDEPARKLTPPTRWVQDTSSERVRAARQP
jgi:hypothetical protein